jgi:hypothetical protein
LNNVPGATSFNDLRLVDGVILSTFHEAIERRSLIAANNTLDKSLIEAIEWMMPYALRRLFAIILVFYEPSNVFGLWEKHKGTMSKHYRCNDQSNFMVVAEPPKLYSPHAPVIIPKTSDDYACTPDNLRRSIGCPRRTSIQLRLTTHTRINKGVTTTLQHLLQIYIRVRKNNNNEFINHD